MKITSINQIKYQSNIYDNFSLQFCSKFFESLKNQTKTTNLFIQWKIQSNNSNTNQYQNNNTVGHEKIENYGAHFVKNCRSKADKFMSGNLRGTSANVAASSRDIPNDVDDDDDFDSESFRVEKCI
jgi:hypothetical protein